MKREKGIAYCGLCCCICSENETCSGCRQDQSNDKDWCKNHNCCIEKGLDGCWQCDEFPCKGSMFDNDKISIFANYVQKYGEIQLMDFFEKNKNVSLKYHYNADDLSDYTKLKKD